MAKRKTTSRKKTSRKRKSSRKELRLGPLVLLLVLVILSGGLAVYFYHNLVFEDEVSPSEETMVEPDSPTRSAPEKAEQDLGNDKKQEEYETELETAVEETAQPNPALPSYEEEDPFYFTRSFDFGWPAYSGKDKIVEHEAFAINYDENKKQPRWVAYRLNQEQVQQPNANGNEAFIDDPLLRAKTANGSDYAGSGYEPAPLTPPNLLRWSTKVYEENFLLSNVSPQKTIFNTGPWQAMNLAIANWAKNNEELSVVSGPIFDKKSKKIGKSKISIPASFFVVAIGQREQELKGIGFIIDHDATGKAIYTHAVTIGVVEDKTGLDFFPALPVQMQRKWNQMLIKVGGNKQFVGIV